MALMSIPKISGRQARELLDGSRLARSGNWYEVGEADEMLDPLAYHDVVGDAALIAAASPLAETVAWLYDRIRETHNDQRCWADAYRAPIEWDPEGKDPARLARAEAHDDCADMLATLLDDEEARP